MVKGQSAIFLALCATAINAAPQYRYRPQWRYDEIEFHYNNPSPYKTGVFDPFNINSGYGSRIQPVHYSPVDVEAVAESHANDIEHVLAAHDEIHSPAQFADESIEQHDSSELAAAVNDDLLNHAHVVEDQEEPVAVHIVPVHVLPQLSSQSDDSDESSENEAVLTIDGSSVYEEEQTKESSQAATLPAEEEVVEAVTTAFEREDVQAVENAAHETGIIIKSANHEDVEATTELTDVVSNIFVRSENAGESDSPATDEPAQDFAEINDDTTEAVENVVFAREAETTDESEDVTASSVQHDEPESSGDSEADDNSVINEFVRDLVDLVSGNSIVSDTTDQTAEDSTDVPDLSAAIRNSIRDGSSVESERDEAVTDSSPLVHDVDMFEFNPIGINADLNVEATTENV